MGTAKAFGVYVSFWGVPKQGYGQYVGHLEIGPALGECIIAWVLKKSLSEKTGADLGIENV